MINAAGYVRVDDAERDSDACFDVNTTGAGARRRGLPAAGVPLVTYSSDLVFDGAPRPALHGGRHARAR